MSRRDYIGNIVSIGNGIKVFMLIKGHFLNTDDEQLKASGVAIELGIVNDISMNTNRDIAPNYLPGNRNPLSFGCGKRLTSGRISLSVIGRDFIDFVVNELVNDPILAGKLKKGKLFDLDTNKFGILTESVEEDELAPVQFVDKKVQYLDQLPPVDLIFIGRGDNLDSLAKDEDSADRIFQVTEDFILNAYYKMVLREVKFLNDNFGFSAGAPVQDQVLDFIVSGGKQDWTLIPQKGSGN